MGRLQDLPTVLILLIDDFAGGPYLRSAIFRIETYTSFHTIRMGWNCFCFRLKREEEVQRKRRLLSERRRESLDMRKRGYLLDPLGYDLFPADASPFGFEAWAETIRLHRQSWKTRRKMARVKSVYSLSSSMKTKDTGLLQNMLVDELERRRWVDKIMGRI